MSECQMGTDDAFQVETWQSNYERPRERHNFADRGDVADMRLFERGQGRKSSKAKGEAF